MLHKLMTMPVAAAAQIETRERPVGRPTRTKAVDPTIAGAAVRALASMARLSQRHQAEVDAALHRAGLVLDVETQTSVLRSLEDDGSIDGQIPLSDGALILTVTAIGMSRAGPA